MPKFMQSVSESMFALLEAEAKSRGITVQELMRAVVVPEWVRANNIVAKAIVRSEKMPQRIT